jgi:hypothetical protein
MHHVNQLYLYFILFCAEGCSPAILPVQLGNDVSRSTANVASYQGKSSIVISLRVLGSK